MLQLFFKHKCQEFSAPSYYNLRICSFSVLLHCKLNILGFWTVGLRKDLFSDVTWGCETLWFTCFNYIWAFNRLNDWVFKKLFSQINWWWKLSWDAALVVLLWKDCIHTVFNQEKSRKQMEATIRMLLCVKTANVGIVVIN